MHQITGYCCWIKLTQASPLPPRTGGKAVNRPPPTRAGSLAFGQDIAALGDVEPPSIDDGLRGITLAWTLDPAFQGDPFRRPVAFQPVKGSREDAYVWIATADGAAWLADAEDFFLLEFGMHVPFSVDPETLPSDPPAQYTFDRWSMQRHLTLDPEFRRARYRPSRFTGLAWRTDSTRNSLQAHLSATSKDVELQKVVNEMASADWKNQASDATSEHQSAWRALLPVLRAAQRADLFEKKLTSLIALIGLLLEETLPPLAYYKAYFDVARPEHHPRPSPAVPIRPHLMPTPSHPAFPGGHACQAMLVASVLEHMNNSLSLRSVAETVGRRRVLGGLHFAMDTAAGKDLAQELFRLLEVAFQSSGSVLGSLYRRAKEELLTGVPVRASGS